MIETGRHLLTLDEVHTTVFPCREVGVSGWSCAMWDHRPTGPVWLESGFRRVPCVSSPRSDVASSLGVRRETFRPGFAGRIEVSSPEATVRICEMRDGRLELIYEIRPEWLAAEPVSGGMERYSDWLAQEASLYPPAGAIAATLAQVRSRPRISVILPTHNPPLFYLYRCVESVRRQMYPEWELCIADDGSGDAEVLAYLDEQSRLDSRIRLVRRPKAGGISEASNTALDKAIGEYVLLLDHDDELHPYALLEVAQRIDAFPDTDLIYSDEDKVNDVGRRSQPAFKPSFDPDLLSCFNYIGHIVCLRRELVTRVGGFRPETDGAQDWDLLLRCTEATSASRIRHIAKPLYHWRVHEASTSTTLHSKPWAVRAWPRVLEDHRKRQNRAVTVGEGLFVGSMRLRNIVPAESRAAVVIRASDMPQQMQALVRSHVPSNVRMFECLLSSLRLAGPEGETEPSPLSVEDLDAQVVVFLNAAFDSVNHKFLPELVSAALREDCGVVGGTTVDASLNVVSTGALGTYGDKAVDPFRGMPFGTNGYMGLARVTRAAASVAPFFFAMRTSVLREIGGVAAIAEDRLDALCAAACRYSVERGLKLLFTPWAVATLRLGASAGKPTVGPVVGATAPGPGVNPNLAVFSNMNLVLQRGIPE